ncbi:MAG: TldD/PmbA family protein [Kosmotoga sp.]|nr:MAG: TldD/PmbA family protein [Kosmotoga sp.]
MTFEVFKNKVFEHIKNKKLDGAELYKKRKIKSSMSTFQGKIDRFSESDTFGISFKVVKNRKAGYSYTEKMDSESAKRLVEDAIENLEITVSDYEEELFNGSSEYPEIKNSYTGSFESLTPDDKFEKLTEFVKKIENSDERIVFVPANGISHDTQEIRIVNTEGLDVAFKHDGGYIYAMAVGKKEDSTKTAGAVDISKDPSKFKTGKMIERISSDIRYSLGAKPVKSGKYDLIIRNNILGEFILTFMQMFSAESVQRGFSPLENKLNKQVANEAVTLIDNPLLSDSPVSRTFDDQGVPTKKKILIEDGNLNTYLYDIRTAKKDGAKSTGNAIKLRDYTDKPSIMPFNVVLKTGEKSFEELVQALDNGIVVTSLDGLHSGADPVTGEFSLGASGFLVENGKIVRGVEEITVSGNFLSMLEKLEMAGNDSMFSSQGLLGSNVLAYVPSAIVRNIDVAGS